MQTISIQKSISLHKKIESEKTSSNLSTKKRFLHQQKSKILAAVRNVKQMKEFWVKTSRSSASACFYPHSHPINLSFRRNEVIEESLLSFSDQQLHLINTIPLHKK